MARNYITDEFLRSNCTHMIFIDADVSFNPIDVIAMLAMDKEIIGGPYPKKCCPSDSLIETEHGVKTIKWIVDSKYDGKVLSFDEKLGIPVWNKVISHSVEKNTIGKKWVGIGRRGRKNLKVTDDHECAVVSDIFNPLETFQYIEAKDTKGFYIIKKVVNNGKNSVNALYSKSQLEFLVGSLLGDGCIRKGYLGFGHSDKQREYIELKHKIFGGNLGEHKQVGSYKGVDYFASFLECPRNAQILKLEELLYRDDNGNKCKKSLKNVLPYFTEKSLAFMYMDDGSMSYQSNGKPSIALHTNNFSEEDLQLFVDFLKTKFDIEFNVTKNNTLYLLSKSNDKFLGLVSPYIIKNLEYKIPEEYRTVEKFDYSSLKNLDFSAEFVECVQYLSSDLKYSRKGLLYDIGVENVHNFFANGHLVHNCIKWSNIRKALMKNPNISDDELAVLGGDIVFNPAPGTTTFNVSELVEVMELGTGFLMMKREVFEKYQKAYPKRMYLPDHVGTAHFGGDREICSFFNVEIDPESRRTWSEDYMFCQECRKIGIKIWMAPFIQLQHTGTYTYQGSLPKVAQYLGEL